MEYVPTIPAIMVNQAVQSAKEPQEEHKTPPIIRLHNRMLRFQKEMTVLTYELDARVIASAKEAIPGTSQTFVGDWFRSADRPRRKVCPPPLWRSPHRACKRRRGTRSLA